MRELIQFAHWRQSSKNPTDKIFMIRCLSTVLCLWCGCDVSVYCNATHQIVECKVEWRFIFKQGNIWLDVQITARNCRFTFLLVYKSLISFLALWDLRCSERKIHNAGTLTELKYRSTEWKIFRWLYDNVKLRLILRLMFLPISIVTVSNNLNRNVN